MLKKILFITVIATALAACSNIKTNSPTNGDAEINAANPGATTSGVIGQEQFDGADGVAAANANKLRAPYNQVYYFNFDRDTVQADDNSSINVQANYLIAHPSAKVRLDGNTDERGSREYNIALGWHRAQAIAKLLKLNGVAADQIITNSYGEEKPVAFGHDEDSYKLNRRVNLIYEAK